MPETAPRLSHVGLYVHDVPKMIDFYTKVLGFVVSDGRRGRPHHLPVAQPQRPPPGRAGARPHHRCRDADGAAGVVQRRHARQGAEGVPQGARRRLRGHPPDLPRQCLVGLFPGPRGQPHRDVLRHAVVRAAAAAASRSTSTSPRTSSFRETEAYCRDQRRASSRWRNGAPRSAKKIAAKLEA